MRYKISCDICISRTIFPTILIFWPGKNHYFNFSDLPIFLLNAKLLRIADILFISRKKQ